MCEALTGIHPALTWHFRW